MSAREEEKSKVKREAESGGPTSEKSTRKGEEPEVEREAESGGPTSEMSTRKGEKSKVKREAESGGSDIDILKDLDIREKALLVRFRVHVLIYRQLSVDFARLSLRKLGT